VRVRITSFYNITVAGPCGSVNDPVAPFRIQRWVNFTNVRVREVKSGADGSLSFNSSVVSYLQNETRFYVGLANSLQANVSLLGQPMWNASAQFIVTGGFFDVDLDRSSHGYHAIPSPRRDYLHVTAMSSGASSLKGLFIMAQFDNGPAQFLDSQDAVSVPQWSHNVTLWSRADINRDWNINVLDMIAVAGKSGQSGPPGWIAEDVNCDGSVNVLDLIAVSNHLGYVTATLEFSMTILVESVCTDGLGAALERWTPDQSSRYLVQIKLPSDYWVAVGRYVSTVSATATSNNLCYVDVLKRPVNLTLETTHFSQNRTVIAVAKAFDPIIGQPVSNLLLDLDSFFVFCKGSGVTNASGMIRWAFTPPADPPDGFGAYSSVYQLVSDSNETYLEGSLWGRIEFDMPTTMTFQGPNPLSIGSGVNYTYDFFVGALGYQQFLAGCLLHFYIEGTCTDGTTFKYNPAAAQISADGHASFGWSANYTGTYNVRADFEGVSGLFFGSECVVAVNASVWSLAILFSVSKTEFAVGDGIRLNATIINMYTGTRLANPNYVFVQFYDVTAGGENPMGQQVSTQTQNGVATYDLTYSDGNNAHAFKAKIVSGNNFLPQGIASNTVQLTVRSPTNMLLDVSRDAHSQNYVVTGRLVFSGSGSKPVTLKVNDTEYDLTTDSSGHFSKSLDLQPNNNQATSYTVTASFAGDSGVKNVTAWSYTLNGTRYAACSTTQYGYGPSTNSTSLTITALSTELATQTKTPEQMQKEAEQNGTLATWHEFSWSYPWYRMHFVGHQNGQAVIDIGIAAFPFADSLDFPNDPWKQAILDYAKKVAWSVIVGFCAVEGALWLLSNLGAIPFGIALFLYYIYKLYSLATGWDSIESLWISVISTVVSLSISIWTGIPVLIPFVFTALIVGAAAVRSLPWGFLCKLITVPINIILLILTCARLVSLGGL